MSPFAFFVYDIYIGLVYRPDQGLMQDFGKSGFVLDVLSKNM